VQAGAARAARMMAERLADRREAAIELDEQRTAQRTLDETVSAQHGRPT
jgi:flagellar biosynthesis chaperone FliJ